MTLMSAARTVRGAERGPGVWWLAWAGVSASFADPFQVPPLVIITTRTAHYESFTMSGTGYNDNTPSRCRRPGHSLGAD